jgi:hypothetical protein
LAWLFPWREVGDVAEQVERFVDHRAVDGWAVAAGDDLDTQVVDPVEVLVEFRLVES